MLWVWRRVAGSVEKRGRMSGRGVPGRHCCWCPVQPRGVWPAVQVERRLVVGS